MLVSVRSFVNECGKICKRWSSVTACILSSPRKYCPMPKLVSHLSRIGLVGIFLLAGCQPDPRQDPKVSYIGPAAQSPKGYDNVSYWDGDSMTGPPSIQISLSEQRAYFYKGGKLAGVSWISTGREGLNTVTGNFHIIQKDKDHKSSVYGDYVDAKGVVVKKDVEKGKDPVPPGAHFDGSPMPYFMRIV